MALVLIDCCRTTCVNVDHAMEYTTEKLMPTSPLVACGDLGFFDLSNNADAQAAFADLKSDERM